MSQWGNYRCSVSLATTVQGDNHGVMSQLVYAATAVGPDCSKASEPVCCCSASASRVAGNSRVCVRVCMCLGVPVCVFMWVSLRMLWCGVDAVGASSQSPDGVGSSGHVLPPIRRCDDSGVPWV